MLIHSQSSRESFPGLCKNYAARKRVFSVSLRFAPFILPVFMGWGKWQIPLISPWLASVILQNFEFPHPFPSNSKQCREFSPAQGQRSQFIPLYSPTYSPGWPGVLPQGQADDMCITSAITKIGWYFIYTNLSVSPYCGVSILAITLPRGHDSWCRLKGARPLGTGMFKSTLITCIN